MKRTFLYFPAGFVIGSTYKGICSMIDNETNVNQHTLKRRRDVLQKLSNRSKDADFKERSEYFINMYAAEYEKLEQDKMRIYIDRIYNTHAFNLRRAEYDAMQKWNKIKRNKE